MSAPVSAMITSATPVEMPGMVTIRSRAPRKGSITTSIRAVSSSMARVWWSIRSRCSRAKKPWCSLKRPVSASVSSGILERSRRLARSASTAGIALPGDQRLEHRPPRHPADVSWPPRTA